MSVIAGVPKSGQLVLPMLEALDELGGRATTGELCRAVAEKIGLPEEARNHRVLISGKMHNAFNHRLRWAQQDAKRDELVKPVSSPSWGITEKGRKTLTKAQPGIVVTESFAVRKSLASAMGIAL